MATREAYYYRVMDSKIEDLLKEGGKYHWLIDYVIKHKDKFGNEDLDFQTGSEIDIAKEDTETPLDKINKTKSWFSIYKGTSRILMIEKNGRPFYQFIRKENGIDENGKSKYKYPKNYVDELTPEGLDAIVDKWENNVKDRYYTAKDGINKKEGYYQTLISRRYSLNCQPQDDLLIIDKEFQIGYINKPQKDTWERSIWNWVNEKGIAFKNLFNTKTKEMSKDADSDKKSEAKLHSGCDFVGINKQGDLVLLELKRWQDGSKIYLSPLQVGTYYKQVAAFMEKYGDDMKNAVMEMLEQKKRLGLIKPAWELPRQLSGNVKLAVVVGCDPGNTHKSKEQMPSKEVKRRFNIVREAIENDIKQEITCYTCDNNGTLKEEIW